LNFQEAEKTYRNLKAQHAAGKLSDADFEAEVAKLRHQDAQGRWWQLGVQTGEWYMHDGQKWNKAKPPTISAAPAAEPSAAPEGGVAQPKRGGALPARLFSAAPAGRGAGGLPPAALIVIIVVVALIAIAAVVGGYLLLSGGRGPSPAARATATPTVVLASLPTPVVPTITLALPTDTPVVVPTIEVTTTEATPTRTPGAARPTATQRPATSPTPAGPTATKTPALPPGVYVAKVRTDPPQPNPGSSVTFYVTFLNTSGGVGPSPWLVKVFRCEAACTADELSRSIGETPKSTASISGGTTELALGTWLAGVGACNFVASPYYVDTATGQVLPFASTSGQDRFYYNFKLCQ